MIALQNECVFDRIPSSVGIQSRVLFWAEKLLHKMTSSCRADVKSLGQQALVCAWIVKVGSSSSVPDP